MKHRHEYGAKIFGWWRLLRTSRTFSTFFAGNVPILYSLKQNDEGKRKQYVIEQEYDIPNQQGVLLNY